ncbi:MAG: hypothetical protein ACR2HN_08510 [Tepidiformaceae bacterium]
MTLGAGLGWKLPALVRRLTECGIEHAIGGAMAAAYWGIPRGTADIDVNIFLDQSEGASALACLAPLGIRPEQADALASLERQGQVRLAWEETPVDLFFAYHAFHQSCRARAVEVPLDDHQITILSAEDLVIFKVLFNRPRDWGDIEQILDVQGEAFDAAYAFRWLDEILGAEDSARARLADVTGWGHEPGPSSGRASR